MKSTQHTFHRKATKGWLMSVLLVAFLGLGQAQTMTMAPSSWVLNAQGAALTIQAIIPGPLASGAVFTGHNITLTVAGTVVAYASDLEYCWIDQNFLVFFNKQAVFTHPAVVALAGTGTVTVLVEGTYTYSLPDGSTHTAALPGGWDHVTIAKPGKKK
ncbi:MAG TPA: hypothetical protein P5550_01485 [Bacteroidales bacterium]|nr:hypothetical protein [Bacteroidales bacterium]